MGQAEDISLEKIFWGFHLVSDRGQAEARFLSLEKILKGFHLVGDWGLAEARFFSLGKKKSFKVST